MKRIFISTSPDWHQVYDAAGWEEEKTKLSDIGVTTLARHTHLYFSVEKGCFEPADNSSEIILLNDQKTRFPALRIIREEDAILRHSETDGHIKWIESLFEPDHIHKASHSSITGESYHDVFMILTNPGIETENKMGLIIERLFPSKFKKFRAKLQLCHLLYAAEIPGLSINQLKAEFPEIEDEINSLKNLISKVLKGDYDKISEVRDKLKLTDTL
jgi:hypothetical protein